MSTRIIIKNLPHNISPTRLKEHFSSSQSGNAFFSATITDAKLVTDPKSGKSRGFAFVGYRTAEDAQKAVEWFNDTFVDMRKVSVEIAKPAGDESLGPTWRDKNREYHARQKQKTVEDEPQETKKRKLDTVQDGEKMAIVKELTGSKRKNKLLAQNPDLEMAQNAPLPPPKAVEAPKSKEKTKKRKTDEVDSETPRKRTQVVETPAVVEVVYDDSAPQNIESEAEDVVKEAPATDLDWLRARTSRTLGLDSDNDDSDNEKDAESEDEASVSAELIAPEPENEQTPATPPATDSSDEDETAPSKTSTAESKILSTGRLFVRNLVYGVTEDDLRTIFSPYGDIEEIHIPLGDNREPLPFAFILFAVPKDALRAFRELDGTDLQGRLMHIIPGDERRLGKDEDLEGKTLKERREIERRKLAGRGGDWGTLFMNQDAVLSSLAARHGVAKSDLLLTPDSSSTDPAVKAAMAETTILTETRTYLTDHGINLASLTSSQKDRSDTVIIAKNFPYGTTHDELVLLFGGTDTVKRILLPPAGTIAFIEFYDAGQARATFKRLAYRRFKDVPLYLEKAPKGIFEAEPTSKITGVEAKKGSSDVLSADTEEPGSTLYIKNLDFSTTQTGLTNAFKNFPGFRLAMLKVKPPNAKGEKLSMGFGFVTFQSKETASSAMNAGVILDGRKLEIKFARQGATEVKTSSTKPTAARKKIVVKNLGFSVTKKDLRELFGTYGHIQSLRLPKKFDNSLRGFAFIEFTTASDARNAMDSLKHTHLLGRHLVLEWAEEEVVTGLEKVRGKVIEGVQAGEVGKLMGLNSSGGRVGDILDEDE